MALGYSGSATELFYYNGGYSRTSTSSEKYLTSSDVNGVYIPMAELWINRLANVTLSVTISTASTNSSTGDAIDDLILAEYALFCADQRLDTVRRNPVNGVAENRHYDTAYNMLLDKYGVWIKGKLVPPAYTTSGGGAAYNDMLISDGTDG